MDYKILILDEMNQKGYQAKSIEDWEAFFSIDSKEEFTKLIKALTEFEEEYTVLRTKKDRYVLAENSGYYKGKLLVNRKGFGFVDFEDRDSIFIAKNKQKDAFDGDIVVVYQTVSGKKPEGEVVKVVERSVSNLIGTIYCKRKPVKFVPDDERVKGTIEITNESEFNLIHGQKVQLHIDSFGRILKCRIVRILGHQNDPGVDVLSILLSSGIKTEFPQEVLDQANQIAPKVLESDKEGRTDLTDQIIVTIDGDDAKDLDDAISLIKTEEGYRLGVHIADVSHYVTENSALDVEAYERGTSTYVTDRVVPMLPHALSNGICSLNPRVERLTITCMMDINHEGDIVNYQIFPSVIRTIERMTYRNVNEILANNKKVIANYEHLGTLFTDMKKCADIIRRKRSNMGAIDFEKDESVIKVDRSGRVEDITIRERGDSEKIIEDFMVLANECVARHTKWLELPSLYRVHEVPLAKKLREFAKMALIMGYKFKGSVEEIRPKALQNILSEAKDSEEYPILSTWLLRCMQKAKYDAVCLGHFGLALEEYTHFTSPIRRYPDLIVHRMLRKYVFNTQTNLNMIQNDEIKMNEIAKQTSICERKAIEAQRSVEDMKKAEYMERFIQAQFEGVISNITNFGFFVQLPNTVEGLVRLESLEDDYYDYVADQFSIIGRRTAKTFKIGQKVRVKVVDASKKFQTIDFEIVGKSSKKKKRNYHN